MEMSNNEYHYTETEQLDDSDCGSDVDPSYDILEDVENQLSNLSIDNEPNSRIGKDFDNPEEDYVKIIQCGDLEKLKVDQCKVYLRKYGLRLSGNKDTLIQRIKEHQEILNGGGELKYPISSFVLNCKGDACIGDVVMFEQNVYEVYNIASRSASSGPCGTRIVAGRIVRESYGAAKQQHTFTMEVLWSKGEKPLPLLHPLLIKGRNLYRLKTMRQKWEDEDRRRKVLFEKHSRGSLARCAREIRLQEKEKRKILRENRASGKRKQENEAQQSSVSSVNSTKAAVQPRSHLYPAIPGRRRSK